MTSLVGLISKQWPRQNSVFLIRVVHVSSTSILENQGYWASVSFHPTFCIVLSSFLPFKCPAFGCWGSTSFFWKHFRGYLRPRVRQQKSIQRWMSRLASGCYDAPKHRLLWWGPPTRKNNVGRERAPYMIHQSPALDFTKQTIHHLINQINQTIIPSPFILLYYWKLEMQLHAMQCRLNSMSRATVPPVPAMAGMLESGDLQSLFLASNLPSGQFEVHLLAW